MQLYACSVHNHRVGFAWFPLALGEATRSREARGAQQGWVKIVSKLIFPILHDLALGEILISCHEPVLLSDLRLLILHFLDPLWINFVYTAVVKNWKFMT